MTRTISAIGFLITFLVVARADSHGSHDGSDKLADGSATRATESFANARPLASSTVNIENIAGFVRDNDKHKESRSYDEFDYAHSERENGKARTTRSNNGCPKCKWEDDDYWEKDEEEVEEQEIEEERSDTECYDEDDGQYREHVHGHGHGNRGSTSPGVQKLGSATPVGQQPVHGGIANTPTNAGTVVKAAISPWNKMSPIGTAYESRPAANPNPRPASDGNDLVITPIREPSWKAGSPTLPNPAVPNPFDAGWSKGRETDSGCTGCVQASGSSNAGTAKQGSVPLVGNVWKQGSSNYFPNLPREEQVPHSASGGVICHGGIYDNCRKNYPGRAESGQFPASGRHSLALESLTFPYPTSPSNPDGANKKGASSDAVYTKGSHPDSTRNAPSSGNFASPTNRHRVPHESVGKPGHAGAEGNPLQDGRPAAAHSYTDKPLNGDNKPGPNSGRYPTFSGTTRDLPPAIRNDHGASGNGDSKIFYINVSPAPGSPVGVKPRDRGAANKPYKPEISRNADTERPSYQPRPQGDDAATNSFYPSGPSPVTSTTKSPHQPGTPGGRNANKPSDQPVPASGNSGWPGSAATNAHPSTTGNIGSECNRGTNGNKSPYFKACVVNNFPEGFDQSSGSFGGADTFPKDFSQSSQSVFSNNNDRPSSGGSSTGFGCVGGTGCTPGTIGPTYVDKTKNSNPLPGGGVSYNWNPFLTGKVATPNAGNPGGDTATSKPIGQGNPFLRGSWQSGNGAAGPVAGTGDKNSPEGSSTDKRRIDKGNSFVHSPGYSHRGDIEIDGATGSVRGPPDSPTAGKDLPIPAASGTFSPGDESQRATSGGPFVHNSGSNWNVNPTSHATSSAVNSPPATNRDSGSVGDVGSDQGGGGNFADQSGQGYAGSLSSGSGFTGAFSGSQASSYASSNVGSHHDVRDPAVALGQGNAGSWPSNEAGAGSRVGSGSWASSSASAYASSSASSWAGTGPISVKG